MARQEYWQTQPTAWSAKAAVQFRRLPSMPPTWYTHWNPFKMTGAHVATVGWRRLQRVALGAARSSSREVAGDWKVMGQGMRHPDKSGVHRI